MKKRFAVISLGCAKNLVDAEVAAGALVAAGYKRTDDPAAADVVVVNTCAFIRDARREARAVVGEVSRQLGRRARLAVIGCFPQYAGARLAAEFPRASVILGVGEGINLPAALAAGKRVIRIGATRPPLEGIAPRPALTAPHVRFVKIAEGCGHPCSYCTIPRIRGPFRSRPGDEIVREVEEEAAAGVREVILLAQDTSRWGADLEPRRDLAGLLRRLARTGIPWVRVLYLHPARLTDELVGAMGELKAVVPYFDLPLQHVVPRLLKAMGRPAWSPGKTLAALARWRELAPGAAFRTSFIVGFPGETDDDFNVLARFVAEAELDHVGVFEYSPEAGTAAARLAGRVPRRIGRARREELMLRQQEVIAARYAALEGKTLRLLVDGRLGRGVAIARAWFQAPETDPVTLVDDGGRSRPGEFIRARVAGHEGYELVAAMVSRSRGAHA